MGVLELKQSLIERGFIDYPPIQLEEEYDRMENPPPFNKFEKTIRQASKEFDDIWERQLSVNNHLGEFGLVLSNCFTDRAFYYLMDRYAHLELEIKEYSKALNKASHPTTKKYYSERGFDSLGKTNIFDIMRSDFEVAHVQARTRYEEYLVDHEDIVGLFKEEIEDYLSHYKQALKNAKSERDKIKKKSEA